MISWIYWDIDPEAFTLPIVHFPILWYGLFFTLGFALGFPLYVDLLIRYFRTLPAYHSLSSIALKKLATQLTDRLTFYMVIATIVGARLGHFLFYERPSDYLRNPGEILRIWEGGLASHGGVIGIVIAVLLFCHKVQKTAPELTWIKVLDFLTVPTALVSFWIRLGNFFNQEILGKPTDVPWAVIFGHPADHSKPFPRHPVQLYEGLFYLALFFFFWRLSFSPSWLKARGKLIGLFLTLVFTFRFFIEFLKEEQSHLIPASFPLTMGQVLSIPVALFGLWLYFQSVNNPLRNR